MMVIRLTLSIPLERNKEYARRVMEIPVLPDFITKRGPYVDNLRGGANQIVIMYQFEKEKLPEASKYVFKQLDAFQGVPGFTFSAYVLQEGKEATESRLDLIERRQAYAVHDAKNIDS